MEGILNTYEMASGQKLNLNKTPLFFSCNTKREAKESIAQTIRTQICDEAERGGQSTKLSVVLK